MNPHSEMLAGVPPTMLALARGTFAAALPAATDISNPAAQISANPTLAVRDGITMVIGLTALALEPEAPRDAVGRPGRRVGSAVGHVQPEPAWEALHQPEQGALDSDLEAEGLVGHERTGVGDRRLAAESLDHRGPGHRAVDRADCKRLEALRDPDLSGREEVDYCAGLGRHRSATGARQLRAAGHGRRGRNQQRAGTRQRRKGRAHPCSPAHKRASLRAILITRPQYHGPSGPLGPFLEIPTCEGETRGRERDAEIGGRPQDQSEPRALGPAEGSQTDRRTRQPRGLRGERVEAALVERLEGKEPGGDLGDVAERVRVDRVADLAE